MLPPRLRSLRVALVAALAGAAACGRAPSAKPPIGDASPASSGVARAPSGSAAPADACRVTGERSPLLVRWTPAELDALDAAMNEGIAVVSADDCRGLRVLAACHPRGRYGYLGAKIASRGVDLSTDEELRVNAPRGQGAPESAADARPIHVDVTRVGARATTRRSLAPSDLRGDCAGATHFVSSAAIGVAVSGPQGSDAGAPARVCQGGRPGGGAPPAGCRSIVSLRITPIAPLGAMDTFDLAPADAIVPIGMCPHGMVVSADRCTRRPQSAPYLCSFGDAVECRAECERGDVNSCDVFAFMLRNGKGVARDASAAAAAYGRGCERDDRIACSSLGEMRQEGEGVPKDEAKAASLFETACAGGEGVACTNLALSYLDGAGVAANRARGLGLLERACDGGVEEACEAFVERVYKPDDEGGDPSRGRTQIEELCDGGNGRPCYWLARTTYLSGDAGAHAAAAPLFDRGCRAGFGPACVMLGLQYRQADGVARDDALATRAMARACELGTPDGCHNLAIAYERGTGVAQDVARAAKLYEQACDGKVANACAYLGDFLMQGTGLAKDEERARKVYARACELGHRDSCARVAP